MSEVPGFRVCAAKCDQCLFTPARVVSVAHMKNILRQCRRRDTYFQCHKHTIRGADVCCRGFYDANPEAANIMRIAARLGVVRFVDEQGQEVKTDG